MRRGEGGEEEEGEERKGEEEGEKERRSGRERERRGRRSGGRGGGRSLILWYLQLHAGPGNLVPFFALCTGWHASFNAGVRW